MHAAFFLKTRICLFCFFLLLTYGVREIFEGANGDGLLRGILGAAVGLSHPGNHNLQEREREGFSFNWSVVKVVYFIFV